LSENKNTKSKSDKNTGKDIHKSINNATKKQDKESNTSKSTEL
jgi:hypothetical protein